MKKSANRHNEMANELKDEGKIAEAIDHYLKAIEADPQWSPPWYNLGLLHKYQCDWEQSLRCNQKAAELDPEDEAAWWNLGIAATAIGNWNEARRAWRTYGIKIPDGDGPIEEDFGFTPIRLNPDCDGEVVWCDRIDPARAIIKNIPLPDSEHRYKDLVLHDGAPCGYRMLEGKEVPVFDELQLLLPSEFGTYTITVDGATTDDVEVLVDLTLEGDLFAEDWSNLRLICRACSEGNPSNEAHDHDHDYGAHENRRVAIAARSENEVHQILKRWKEKAPNVEIVEVACALTPALVN